MEHFNKFNKNIEIYNMFSNFYDIIMPKYWLHFLLTNILLVNREPPTFYSRACACISINQ